MSFVKTHSIQYKNHFFTKTMTVCNVHCVPEKVPESKGL
jgi:hypothetical protein